MPIAFRDRDLAASGTEGILCVLDGRPGDLGPLRTELRLEPGSAAEDVVAAGWRRWGEDVLRRVPGDVAVLLWDRRERRGLVARDRMGMRGVFWCRGDGAVLVASELRDLLALMPAHPGPDEVALVNWIARSGLRDGRTLVAGVRRLPPGHLLELGDGASAQPRAWWEPSPAFTV